MAGSKESVIELGESDINVDSDHRHTELKLNLKTRHRSGIQGNSVKSSYVQTDAQNLFCISL